MNKCLEAFLKGLSDKDAKDIWEYLDSYSGSVATDMIEVVADSHSVLYEKLCGEIAPVGWHKEIVEENQ